MAPTISLLICTHRAPASLDLLFDSLAVQKWQAGDEIIVVDNGIDPHRALKVKQRLDHFHALAVRVVLEKESKVGLTNARLKGLCLIKTDWLLLLDDDNSLAENALSGIRQRISLNPQLGGICPRIEPIWVEPPPNWVIALGHDVLSYNSSTFYSDSDAAIEWEGGKWGVRPPGGGMIIHRSAAEAFLELSRTFPLLRDLGHRGASLGSGEDYFLYLEVYRMKRPTAYDGSIVIRHLIPPERMHLGYLCRLFFQANYGFALIALALVGKILFLPSIAHAVIRLSSRLLNTAKFALFPQVLMAFACALAGYVCGTFGGLFRGDLSLFKRKEFR